MKKILSMLCIGAAVLMVAGCSSDYVMSTKSGEMIVTQGNRKLIKTQG